MVIIGFFRDVFKQFPTLFNIVTTPLGELNNSLNFDPVGSWTIIGCLGAGLGATLVIVLAVHIIRLFVG